MTHDTHRNPIAMPEPIFLADTDLRALAGTSAEAQRTLQVRIEPH